MTTEQSRLAQWVVEARSRFTQLRAEVRENFHNQVAAQNVDNEELATQQGVLQHQDAVIGRMLR
ncbi:MAG: hypothetical protein AAFY57_20650, partial [Cyanobacteria bacterium J06642_2]